MFLPNHVACPSLAACTSIVMVCAVTNLLPVVVPLAAFVAKEFLVIIAIPVLRDAKLLGVSGLVEHAQQEVRQRKEVKAQLVTVPTLERKRDSEMNLTSLELESAEWRGFLVTRANPEPQGRGRVRCISVSRRTNIFVDTKIGASSGGS